MLNKRINIFTGHFGSGKTEVAINYALKMVKKYPKTAIVDLDIVNPYFRTTDAKSELEEKGIWVVIPLYANTNVDIPALPAEMNTLFERKDLKVVFDVGGDDLGARVLSRYNKEILEDDYEMYFVINTRRPMTDSFEKIINMIYEIEATSRLKITKLINNTNLLSETTEMDVLEGHQLIKRVSDKLNIPIAFISCFGLAAGTLKEKTGVDLLILDKFIKLPWD
jgi:hypothetical protein